jgi:hypothetical protein
MTRRVMNNLYEKLYEVGFEFMECNYSHFKEWSADSWYTSYGILSEKDGTVLTVKRLSEIMAIAKSKKSYLILLPEIREVQVHWKKAGPPLKLQENERTVCIVQKGLLQTIKDTRIPVIDSLKRNFLYYQEEEEILELETVLDGLLEALETFERNAYNVPLLGSNARPLRKLLVEKGEVFRHDLDIQAYMENKACRERAESLCEAVLALRIIQ